MVVSRVMMIVTTERPVSEEDTTVAAVGSGDYLKTTQLENSSSSAFVLPPTSCESDAALRQLQGFPELQRFHLSRR